MGPFYTNAGPVQGPFLYRDAPKAIDVFDAPDDPTPIGTALCLGSNRVGVAVWKLTLNDTELPGHWVVIDRKFVPAQ